MCNCWLCVQINEWMILRIRAQEAERRAEAEMPDFLRQMPVEEVAAGVAVEAMLEALRAA